MKIASYANFQVGMVDDPSIEDKGGFEFASGMDIFSEPGVMKASPAMAEVSYGVGAAPSATPFWMVSTVRQGVDPSFPSVYSPTTYIATGSKILESTDGNTFNLFRTNSNGTIRGMGLWNGYLIYLAQFYGGLVQVGVPGGANDSYFDFSTDGFQTDLIPVIEQAGTFKVGGRNTLHSIDELFNLTKDVFKLPQGRKIVSLANHFTNVFAGVGTGVATNPYGVDSSVFSWRGTILSTGAALPDAAYEMQLNGMNALLSDSRRLIGFPDKMGDILVFDGAGFVPFRKLFYVARKGTLKINPGAVTQYLDKILFAGDSNIVPGVYTMQGSAICQSFVPATATPGVDEGINIGFVKVATDGTVYIGYKKSSNSTYHIEKSTANKQNNATVTTLVHKARTDQLKRWYGIKLNLKPLGSCSVAVSYRTTRDGAFTSAGTITAANQDKPILLTAQPRTRDIQFKFTYTTSTTTTPELLSYDVLYEILSSTR